MTASGQLHLLKYSLSLDSLINLAVVSPVCSVGELKLGYLDKLYSINVGLFQMAILLQFNDGDSLSAEDLQERTNLERKDWKRHLQPLIDAKLLVEVI